MTETATELKARYEAAKAKITEKEKQLVDLEARIADVQAQSDKDITALENKAHGLRAEVETLEAAKRNIKPDDLAKKDDFEKLRADMKAVVEGTETRFDEHAAEICGYFDKRNRNAYLLAFTMGALAVLVSVVGFILRGF